MLWSRALFFAIIGVLMLSELVFSNLGTLGGNLEATAQNLGLSVGAERTRLLILILLDGVAGVGALLALWALLRPTSAHLGQIGVQLATGGLIGYGLYQLGSALFQLAPKWKGPIVGVGLTYIVLGLAAWWIGRGLRK